MEIFWNTIAAYNAATWPAQIGFTLVAAMLLVLLYLRPTPAVRIAMKLFMAFLNFWIAGVYYMIYCRPREYHGMLALFWAIMGGIWIYELLVKRKYPLIPTLWMIFEDSTFAFRSGDKHRSRRIYGK